MDINVTTLCNSFETLDLDASRFSSSRHESGLDDIVLRTWRAALAYARANPFGIDRDELIDHFVEYGAWTTTELERMTMIELDAILLQFIASDYREHYEDITEINEESLGALLANTERDEWTYYIGI
jgi:hypothetical protein